MKTLGTRALAAMLWTSSFVLMIISGDGSNPDQLTLSNWALFTAVCAATLTACIFLHEHVQDEADRNADRTAEAVADAVGVALAKLREQDRV